MASIFGALARPSIRSTTRFRFTSTSVGTSEPLNFTASSGWSSTSTRITRTRVRSLRARWASRLSMRRAGPDRSDVKNTSKGLSSLKMVSSWIWTAGGAATCVSPVAWAVKLHCLQMGSWYWIGVCAGLGVAVGVLLGAVFAGTRIALTAALVLAAGIGGAIGFALGPWAEALGGGRWAEALGGGVGGVLGAIGSAQLASGTMRRGGARFGVAVFFGLAALA